MNKSYLLASVAAAVLASSGQAQARDFYVSVLGGGNWWQSQSRTVVNDTSTVFHFDTETGFILGGAVGVHLDNWLHGLRAELEASYRRNRLNGNWTSTDNGNTGAMTGHVSTFAMMANVWYDIDCGSKYKPYIGGGAGWARTRFDAVVFTTDGTRTRGTTAFDASGFAWQLGAGVNYEVMPGVDLGLGYRFTVDPKLHLGGEGFADRNFTIDNQSHSVAVSLTIDIDS